MPHDIAIQDREELIFLLCEAAEFEHAVMCTYLFAQWSLKQSEAEGVSATELGAIQRWRASLRQIALEEMLHLTLVNNILAAIGAAPHLWRPAFPVRPGHFPADVSMPLKRFSAEALDHFLYVERPETSAISDDPSFARRASYARPERPDLLSPSARDYHGQGQLYHGIIGGLERLSGVHGEAKIFVGHGDAQVTSAEFGLPGLFRVADLASARRAIDEIVTQGEGAPAHVEGSHFARFAAVAAEFEGLRRLRPAFEPARPVADNPVLGLGVRQDGVARIEDPLTSKTADLGNAIYALTMRVFAQIFSPAPLPPLIRSALGLAATELMLLTKRMGEALSLMPMGASRPHETAGLNFMLPISSGQLVQSCATQILSERTRELEGAAAQLQALTPLSGVAQALNQIAQRFERIGTLPHENALRARQAPMPVPAKPTGPVLYKPSYDPKRCIHARHCVIDSFNQFDGVTQSPRMDTAKHDPAYIRHVAENCPSGAITFAHADGSAAELAPAVNIVRVRENGPYAAKADMAIEGIGPVLRATLCRCGRSKNKPFCDNTHIEAGFRETGEPATIPSDPLEVRGGPVSVVAIENGPLQFNGNLELACGTGRTLFRSQTMRLCRCGGSATKPICDGSHLNNGFRSDK